MTITPSNNFIQLKGFLARNPEVFHTNKDTRLVKLRIAVNDQYVKSDGTVGEKTSFPDLTFWGDDLSIATMELQTGDYIAIRGTLNANEKSTKDGKDYYNTYVNVKEIDEIRRKSESEIEAA